MKKGSITFLPINETFDIHNEKTIMELAKNNNVYIEGICGGKASCGKCKIRIIQGEAGRLTEKEKIYLTENEIKNNYRLACQVGINNETMKECNEWVVFLKEKSGEQIEKKKIIMLPDGFYPDNYEDESYVNVDNSEEINKKCGNFGIALDIGTTTMVAILWNLTNAQMVDIVTRENPQRVIGADILSRMQYTNESKENINKVKRMTINSCNRMIEDLFINLYYNNKSVKNPKNFENTRSFEDIAGKSFIEKNLKKVVVVGNTAMLHFFMGYSTIELSKYPFLSVIGKNIIMSAPDIGLRGSEDTRIEIVDIISGQIGSDITAAILAVDLLKQKCSRNEKLLATNNDKKKLLAKTKCDNHQQLLATNNDKKKLLAKTECSNNKKLLETDTNKKELLAGIECDRSELKSELNNVKSRILLGTGDGNNELLIDIGTNGEMVLKSKQQFLACSTAAGPAFEGGNIFNGMRAEEGAIQGITFEGGDIRLNVIGNKTAKGICGSGLISIVSVLLDLGVIDETGRIIDVDEARRKGISFGVCRRIFFEEDETNSFILKFGTNQEKIVLKQKDIREFQVAKSAICSGIKTLLKEGGVKIEELNHIKVAGTFGNYLDIESAIKTGLFPDIKKEKIVLVGNAAGTGASMILLSKQCAERAKSISKIIERIELSESKCFLKYYLKNMNFSRENAK